MGAKQTKLTKSKVLETEKKSWWKKGKIRKTKQKTVEVDNGISQECEETTEELICKDYIRHERREVKIIRGNFIIDKSFQEKGSSSSYPFGVPEKQEQNTKSYFDSQSESKIKHLELESGDGKVALSSQSKLYYESEHAFSCGGKFIKREDDEKVAEQSSRAKGLKSSDFDLLKHNQRTGKCAEEQPNTECKVNRKNVLDSLNPPLCSQESESNKQKSSINSLLDPESKASSLDGVSHTEIKVTNIGINTQSPATQSLDQLKLSQIDYENDDLKESFNNGLQSMRYFKTVESSDEEDFSSSVKELSSSYPDSALHSDESSQVFTQTSDEYVSLSTQGSNSDRAGSWTLLKQGYKYNEHLGECCTQQIHLSGIACNNQDNDDQTISTQCVIKTGKLDKSNENSKKLIGLQNTAVETVTTTNKLENRNDDNEIILAVLNTTEENISKANHLECDEVSVELDTQILAENVLEEINTESQIGMTVNPSTCYESVQNRNKNCANLYDISGLMDLDELGISHGHNIHQLGFPREMPNEANEAKNELVVVLITIFYIAKEVRLSRIVEKDEQVKEDSNHDIPELDISTQNKMCAVKPLRDVKERETSLMNTTVTSLKFVSCCEEIRNNTEVADKENYYGSCSETDDFHETLIRFILQEIFVLLCFLYFLEYIKQIESVTVKKSTKKERKPKAEKSVTVIYERKNMCDDIDRMEKDLVFCEKQFGIDRKFSSDKLDQCTSTCSCCLPDVSGLKVIENKKHISVLKFAATEYESKQNTSSDIKSHEQNAEKDSNELEEIINFFDKSGASSACQNANRIVENQTALTEEDSENLRNTSSFVNATNEFTVTANAATNLSEIVDRGLETNDIENEEEITDITLEIDFNLNMNGLVLDKYDLGLKRKRIYWTNAECSNTKKIKFSESIVKESQKEMPEQIKRMLTVQKVKITETRDLGDSFMSTSRNINCTEPYIKLQISKLSATNETDIVKIGSTKRLDVKKGKKKITPKETRNEKLKVKHTKKQLLSSNVKSVICSNIAARDSGRSSKNKHRVMKTKWRKSKTTYDSGAGKPNLEATENCRQFILSKNKAVKRIQFCNKCHQPKNKAHTGTNCTECHPARGELDSGKFQYHVISRDDSGISSLLTSIRSSILSEMESVQNITSLGRNKSRKQVLKRLLNLGLFEQQFKRITKGINIDALANVDHNIIAFPGLQSYFDSLRNGVTPSLQERMAYEWLRLMSFSAYSGGGSPVHLARSGFYHHHGNETRCFSCDASYSNWQYTDDVQAVHRRISPNCPFVAGGRESNGNISIEASSAENQQSQAPVQLIVSADSATPQSTSTQSAPNTERQRTNTSVSHGEFSFGAAAQINVGGLPTTTAGIGGGEPRFGFNQSTSLAGPSGFNFSQSAGQQTGSADVSSQVTNQLGALTIQQSAGAQQPTEEPLSTNPIIVPTQPSQIARQTDGDAQLTISAQQQPEDSDRQQNTVGNQGTSGASFSGSLTGGTESADILQLGQLKHPRYGTMAVRMSSFASWPNYLNQTPRQMAYAGFFHPGVADFARCFCCGGGLRNWEADDDPMVEHARWYPRCEYINKLKGTHFVQAVLRRHREHMAERQRDQDTSETTFTSPDPMTTDIAASLLEMGFTQERAREAILTVRRLRGRSEVSIEEVTAWMLDDDNAPHADPTHTAVTSGPRDTVGTEQAPEQQRNASPANSSSGGMESTATTQGATAGSSGSTESTATTQGASSGSLESTGDTQGATGVGEKQMENKPGKDKVEVDSSSDEMSGLRKDKSSSSVKSKSKKDKKSKTRKGHSPTPGGASSSSHGDVDTKSLKEENKLLKQMQVCKICMDKYVSVTFLPCGHLVCCEDCARNMRKCPICRKRIKGQVRTFMS